MFNFFRRRRQNTELIREAEAAADEFAASIRGGLEEWFGKVEILNIAFLAILDDRLEDVNGVHADAASAKEAAVIQTLREWKEVYDGLDSRGREFLSPLFQSALEMDKALGGNTFAIILQDAFTTGMAKVEVEFVACALSRKEGPVLDPLRG